MTLRTRPAAVCLVLFLLIGALATISAAPGADIADAARNKDATGLQTLLKQRADVNAPQPDGTTALHWAAHWNDLETVNLLLRAGANPKGCQPLWRHAAFRSREFRQRCPGAGVAYRGC
jgi:ankyrin repeat protein